MRAVPSLSTRKYRARYNGKLLFLRVLLSAACRCQRSAVAARLSWYEAYFLV